MAEQPILYALADNDSHSLESERYATRELAEGALEDRADADNLTIVETRGPSEVDPDVIAAEEAQIDANGRRDVDEPSDG